MDGVGGVEGEVSTDGSRPAAGLGRLTEGRPWCWWVGVALLGALVGLWATRAGVWAGTDSATYVSVARSVRAGQGTTAEFFTSIDAVSFDDAVRDVGHSPLLLWPPMYPWLLALVSFAAGGSIENAARWIAVGSFAVVAVTTAALTRRLAFGRWGPAVLAAAFVVLQPSVGLIGSGIYSDLPFLALSGVATVSLLAFLSRWRPGPLLGFAVAAGAACLVRFVGVALPLAAVVLILTTGTRPWRVKVPVAGLAAASALPLVAWMMLRGATVGYHAHEIRPAVPWGQLGVVPESFRSWLWPGWLGGVWAWSAAVVGVAAIGIVVLGRRSRFAGRAGHTVVTADTGDDEHTGDDDAADDGPRPVGPGPLIEPRAARAIGAVLGSCLVVLLVATSTVGVSGLLTDRILLPLLPLAAALGVAAAWRLCGRARSATPPGFAARLGSRWVGPASVAVMGLFVVTAVVGNGIVGLTDPIPGLTGPLGAAASPLRDATSGYPLVVTSSTSKFYADAGRAAVSLPLRTRPSTGDPNPEYQAEMVKLRELVQRRQAVVVYYAADAFFLGEALPTRDAVVQLLGAKELASAQGASVFGRPLR